MTIDELLIQNPSLADAVTVLIDSAKASGDTEALKKWDNLRMDSEINSYPIRMTPEDQACFAEAILNPPPIAEPLARAFERHKELFNPKP